jgi:hypothetical protein
MDISTLYPGMRVLLGDNDPQGNYEFTDQQLGQGLQAAYQLGGFPPKYSLTDGSAAVSFTGTTISPDPGVRDFAIILCEACLAIMVGDQGAFSFSTRAISEQDSGQRKRDILQYTRTRIYELRDSDAVFETRAAFLAFLQTLDSFADLAEVKQTGRVNVDVNVASDNVSLFL